MPAGDKVLLREKRMSDVGDDYAWRADTELCGYDAAPPLGLTPEEYQFYYAGELRSGNRLKRWFAIDTLDGKHIGNCMYYEMDEGNRQVKVGIMIGDRRYWSQGYGTDAINTLVEHLFNETRVERVFLDTLTWNHRAQKCFQKCGFVPCGRASRKGNDFLIMELKRSWRKQAKAEAVER